MEAPGMLLRSIKLEGWRCFANAMSVGEFGDGLNIIHGPNGVGKSTLMMALVRAMFDNHNSAGQDVEALRPWGKDLSPLVELQFEHEGTRYRLSKGFLGRKQSELLRWERDRFERFKEARDADEFVRSLLLGDDAKRGVSKPQHWGLAQVLWVPQGELTLDSLSGAAKDLVQQALGAQLKSMATSSIERRIVEQYDAIYTATGKLKQGASAARVVQLEQLVGEATTRVESLRQRLSTFEEASRRMEDLRQLADQAQRRELELAATIAAARSKSHDYLASSGRCESRCQELIAARAKVDDAKARLDTIATARSELSRDEETHKRLLADHPLLQAAVAQCDARVQQARAHAESIRSRRQEIDRARHHARQAAALADAARKCQQLSAQLESIGQADAELERLRAARSQVIAPTAKQLAALRKAEADVREARLRLEASLITLTFVAEEAATLKTLVGEPEGNHLVEPGQRLVVRGSPETAIHFAGLGTIRATGPVTSVQRLRAELSAADTQWQTLITPWSSATLSELEQAQHDAQELDQQIGQWLARCSAILDKRTVEQLRADLLLAQRTQNEICDRQAQWKQAPPSSEELHIEAERLENSFRSQIDDAEAKVEAARSAHAAAVQKLSSHEAQMHAALDHMVVIRKRLEQLTTDGRDDARRQTDYDELLLQFDAAKAKLAQAEQELKTFADDPRREVANLEKEQAALRQQRDKALEALHREDALLQQLASEAPYSALADAEEKLAQGQRDLARERLSAEAVKLLHDTLAAVQREALQAVIDPVRRRAQQTLQRIAGGKFEGISFGEELLPTAVQPQFAEPAAVSLDQLSGGEREQVYFSVRLALADIAFRSRRELLVLDDVFVYTDMTRVARIVSILEEAAERFQIVLLTCHPERYRGISSARFFDLAELTREQPSALAPDATTNTSKATAKTAISTPKSHAARGRTFWESVEH